MPPSPGHFWANSVTAAPCGQKKQVRASSHNQSVTGPEDEMAGIRFRLATATTNSNTRSRRPSTRSSPGFLLAASGRMALPPDKGSRRGASPDIEDMREQRSLSVAHGVDYGGYGNGAVLHERFGQGAALVPNQAAEVGALLGQAALKKSEWRGRWA